MDDIEDEAEAEAEAVTVEILVRKEVHDWDDEEKVLARFKALSGQRCDWEPLYIFWRDLIIKVSRGLRICIIRPSRITHFWFRRSGGLTPLCLPRVLQEMHLTGDLLPSLSPPTSRLSYIFRKALDFLGPSFRRDLIGDRDDLPLSGDNFILTPLLEERAVQLVSSLSEIHWTTSCVVTMTKFQEICLGSEVATAILDFLSTRGRASHLIINRTHRIEGVKVCLTPEAVSTASNLDYSTLHLLWTAERLEQQLDLIDQRCQRSKNLALAYLKSGNKIRAIKYAKELKQGTLGREKCTALLDRVEKVLQAIIDAEFLGKVSEALQNSARTIQESQISLEEVELCLQEVDKNIDSLKQSSDVLESSPAYSEIFDNDIEDEFNKLLLEIKSGTDQVREKSDTESCSDVSEFTDTTHVLCKALSDLDLKVSAVDIMAEGSIKPFVKCISKEGCSDTA